MRTAGRKYGVTLVGAAPIFLSAVFIGVTLGLLLGLSKGSAASSGSDQVGRANAIIRAWNDMAASTDLENGLLHELQENLKANPPYLVFDARRRELYRQVIAEHERQLKNFRIMEANDR